MENHEQYPVVRGVLDYLLHCAVRGKHPALIANPDRPHDLKPIMDQLATAGAAEVHYLVEELIDRGALRAQLDLHITQDVISTVRTRNDRDQQIIDLIRADAPLPMLVYFFGLKRYRFTALRADYNIPDRPGRPSIPERAHLQWLWDTWRVVLDGRPLTEATAEDYLSIYEQTHISLRVVWTVAQRWINQSYCPGTRPNETNGEKV